MTELLLVRFRPFTSFAAALLVMSAPVQAVSPYAPAPSSEVSDESARLRGDDNTGLYILGGIGVVALVVVLLGLILDNDTGAEPQPGPPISP